MDGKLGIGKITKFDSEDTGVALAGEVKEFDLSAVFRTQRAKEWTYFLNMVLCRFEAWKMSGLTEATIDPTRLGVIVGSGIGG